MPYQRVSKRPEGIPTRGKTASNRLRRVDNFILLYEPGLFTRTDSLFTDSIFVDLGYGFAARTTLESASRFRRLNPDLKILGVEIDKERVENALPFADEKTFFRLGGFNLPLRDGEQVRLIRAFNVLRQYEEKDFAPAYERLAQYVLPGGLMIEGTSMPYGQIWTANVARRLESGQWKIEALVFSTNFRLGFDVQEFQTVLPKNLIHHMIDGEPIYEYFEAWKASAAETSAIKTFGARQWFVHTAEALAKRGYKLNLQKKFLSRGYLIWELWNLPEEQKSGNVRPSG
jgi:SAM-dependent methyltransferase